MSRTKSSKKKGIDVKRIFESLLIFIKKQYKYIVLLICAFLAVSAINFFSVSSSQTVDSFDIDDIEIGQVMFRNIVAPRDIPADSKSEISVKKGEKIVKSGFPVTEEAYRKLQKMADSPVYFDARTFADIELFVLILIVLWFVIFAVAPLEKKVSLSELIFQLICFAIVFFVASFGQKLPAFNSPLMIVIIIPTSLFVLIDAVLFGQLSSAFFSLLLSFGVFAATGWGIVPFIFTITSCLAATVIVCKIERRIDMVFASIVLAAMNMVIIIIDSVIFNESFSTLPVLLGGVAANGFLSGILALGLLTPVEFILNTASVFRLMDLSDLNNPLMRKMLITASGTYQHSQMVAQLAEVACRDIGANALLARVGAYYHDIGKMEHSEYFVENQINGVNKHDSLNPSLSVSVIRSHVRKGVEKAHQLHLPQAVIDIIEEHHGNSVIAYFLEEAKQKDPDVNPADYSYFGNPPSTKESAVVMCADTVEAACRTLENPNEERLDKFIRKLITAKMESHQLDNCPLTFQDTTIMRKAFVKLLLGYYHNRIEYPDQKDEQKAEENQGEEKTSEISDGKVQLKDRTDDGTVDGVKIKAVKKSSR